MQPARRSVSLKAKSRPILIVALVVLISLSRSLAKRAPRAIAGVLSASAGAALSTTLASSPVPGRRISTGWPAAAAEQAGPAASPPRALAPALPHAAAAATEAAAAVAPRSAPRRDHGREVLLLKRAAPAALVEQKPPEPKAPAPAQLGAPLWLGELSQRAVLGPGAACAAASPPRRSRSPSAAMRARAE